MTYQLIDMGAFRDGHRYARESSDVIKLFGFSWPSQDAWLLDAINYAGTPGTAPNQWRYHESDKAGLWSLRADGLGANDGGPILIQTQSEAEAQSLVATLNSYPEPCPNF